MFQSPRNYPLTYDIVRTKRLLTIDLGKIEMRAGWSGFERALKESRFNTFGAVKFVHWGNESLIDPPIES
jgi:hypothetical protein